MRKLKKIVLFMILTGMIIPIIKPKQIQAASNKWESKIYVDQNYRGRLSKDGKEAWLLDTQFGENKIIPKTIVLPKTFKGVKVTKIGPELIEYNYYDTNEFLSWGYDKRPGKIVKEVVIPSTVTEIGDCTFRLLYSLERVNLPKGLKEIGPLAFAATSIETLQLPEGLKSVTGAFYGCIKLKNLKIPASVKKLTVWDFNGCESLTNLTIDNKSKYFTVKNGVVLTKSKKTVILGLDAFKKVKLPNTVTKIKKQAFYFGDIEEVSIPSSVKIIGREAFYASNLKKVTLHKGLKEIGIYAFECRNLKSITIPKTVTKIAKGALNGSRKIKLKLEKGNKVYASTKNCIYKKKNKELIALASKKDYFVIPDGIKIVNRDSLIHAEEKVMSVTYPSSLQKLGKGWSVWQHNYKGKEMKKIIFKGKIPPTFSGDFELINMKIYVPKESLEAYEKAFEGKLDKKSQICIY